MKALTAIAVTTACLQLAACGNPPADQEAAANKVARKALWAETGDTYECHWYNSCKIVIKVEPNNDPDPIVSGPGKCRGKLVYSAFVIHTGFWGERKVLWEIDEASRNDFQFAGPNGVVIVRNMDNTSQHKPAFVSGTPEGGGFKFTYRSSGEYTLPAGDPNAPGFELNLVRISGNAACGPADPPIVNQP